jgi:hypothetical protein
MRILWLYIMVMIIEKSPVNILVKDVIVKEFFIIDLYDLQSFTQFYFN